ncbi:hypothetical protein [Levilactobacillus namurensis]|uniref:hypothetical protein n=1 Tax=Levilactobacillus namurensis TaxID=380393 RepID=UPI000466DF58|nr:hypothetical protein [Levilactobacillus namurensis]
MRRLRRYLVNLIRGTLALLLIFLWNIRRDGSHWVIPVTFFTGWLIISWLLFPVLRERFSKLYVKNDTGMTSYKTAALAAHQDDMRQSHKDRRWTSNGVTVNPWAYQSGNTQSTDDILNPIYLFCEHLLISVVFMLLGPVILVVSILVKRVRRGVLHTK